MSQDQPSAGSPEPSVRTVEPEREGHPPWLDRTEYPFEPHFVDLGPGRLHYVDEGEGRPILFLHGNPTWSFLYRDVIRDLSDEYRAIAPDYYGFGLSDKPRYWSYRPEDQARIIAEFIEELGLENLTLVVHDWGGPIGISYAEDHPENVESLVVLNSAVWPLDDRLRFRLWSSLVGGPVGRYFGKRYNYLPKRMLSMGVSDRSRLSEQVTRHYTAPLAEPGDRMGTWIFAREVTGSSAWLARLWDRRAAIADIPTLIVWGMNDRAYGTDILRTWQGLFPEARTVEYADASHYVPEEKGPQLAAEIRDFLAER